MKPVALVTGEVSAYRREPFRMLDEAEDVEVIAFDEAGELEAARRVRAGRYRAVVHGLGGRISLPATYAAARRAGIPFVLWASLWAHPRTPAHLASWLPTRHLYRHADAVVTYGPHVSAYVRAGGARNVHVAPQSVDNEFWRAPVSAPDFGRWPQDAETRFLFVGRPAREKGVSELVQAFSQAGLAPRAALLLVGVHGVRAPDGVVCAGRVAAEELRSIYAASDALILPSIRTRTFREPWGLVVNEAMHQRTPVIASDAVGAVAGGLVRDGRNGLVAPAGDARALATRIEALAADGGLRERLARAAREDVEAFSEVAWVAGMRRALHAVGASGVRA